ncbi:MAG: hypothetical protein ACK4IT_05110 [Thioalkalivibrionaceae bacterium]
MRVSLEWVSGFCVARSDRASVRAPNGFIRFIRFCRRRLALRFSILCCRGGSELGLQARGWLSSGRYLRTREAVMILLIGREAAPDSSGLAPNGLGSGRH